MCVGVCARVCVCVCVCLFVPTMDTQKKNQTVDTLQQWTSSWKNLQLVANHILRHACEQSFTGDSTWLDSYTCIVLTHHTQEVHGHPWEVWTVYYPRLGVSCGALIIVTRPLFKCLPVKNHSIESGKYGTVLILERFPLMISGNVVAFHGLPVSSNQCDR